MNSLVAFSVRRPVTVAMMTLAVLLFGMVALGKLAVTLLPDLSYPTLTIRTDYDGAAPLEVETLISKPIEESVGVVKGLKSLKSYSRPGRSDVVLEFEWGTDMDWASLEVREKLDLVLLPLDVKAPIILRYNPNLDPVLRLALSAKDADLKALRSFADDDLKQRLEGIDGVASVRPGGGLEQEVQILVDDVKAARLGLTLDDISKRLAQENINLAGGRIEDGGRELLVRTLNQYPDLATMGNTWVADGVRLKDIATIRDGHKQREAISRVNGTEMIELAVYKEGDANTVAMAKAVKAALPRLNKMLPPGAKLTLLYDQSSFIEHAIDEVMSSAWLGGLLAMLVLYLFLRDFKATAIISLAIPVSVIATFNLMLSQTVSLNIMSLGGLALAVGMLVDNAIVVLENIARYRAQGLSPLEAAHKGGVEVAGAITASTLTSLAVFVPLVFVEGIAGQLFRDQALTVTFALSISLLVALSLIPMLAARGKAEQARVEAAPLRRRALPLMWLLAACYWCWHQLGRGFGLLLKPAAWLFGKGFGGLQGSYQRLLPKALARPWTTLGIMVLVVAASGLLATRLPMTLLPNLAQGEFFLDVTLPPGSRLEETDQALDQLAKAINQDPRIAHAYSQAGGALLANQGAADNRPNQGRLNIVLKHASDEMAVTEVLRQALKNQPGVEGQFQRPALFTFDQDLEVEISGHNLDSLATASRLVAAGLESRPRFTDIKAGSGSGQPELTVDFDQARLASLGLTAPQVGKRIANKVRGTLASRYQLDDRKIDMLVRLDDAHRDEIADLAGLWITPNLPLSAVAKVKERMGPSEITRVDQSRVALVDAAIAFGDLKGAEADAKAMLASLKLPPDVRVELAGQSGEREAAFGSLEVALLVAIFLVYLVMASQFESFIQPLLILVTVPLAGAGAVLGLWLTGTPLSVVVFIGLIMLAGIVVNNAIVLIDRVNQLRAEGQHLLDAIAESAESRLRPIVMTTLTTVLGLLPMALGLGEGAEVRAPMAIAVMSGLVFATLLTLVVLPVLLKLTGREAAHE
ncbi:efflux RND transporter permease subunit [Gallaecimonas kandeliae]|uniref:efflux RND transporter permease subunit n=1 Tax=Gallaecimonas kandeliae TaxID=3029055 RepID=UPI0026497762|nr:efflux RND transporter permease subunit [Gallaecimonas kandeliae]WKE67064.1 efflux RND transporter permease subunit [Gallaecimonas kandeliae]